MKTTCGGLLYLLEEIEVKNVIVGKQFENSTNLEIFKKIIESKKIKTIIVKSGDKINIEKDLYFDVLWPNTENKIIDKSLNNNSLVSRLCYKSFSMIFTGDIEEKAENELLSMYKNTNKLKSNIIKIPHHGSKTSTTEGFINAVNPQIALIGVGKNNVFGHPNKQIIDRLQNNRIKVFRTDNDGEISITINRNGHVTKVEKCIK